MITALSAENKTATVRDQIWTVAVAEAARLAVQKYPCGGERLKNGYVLALQGHVSLDEGGRATVRSQAGTLTYSVAQGACTCLESVSQRARPCKHRYATAIAVKAQRSIDDAIAQALQGAAGAECPQCGYPTVVAMPLYHKRRQHFDPFQLCRFVLRYTTISHACNWGAML